jgi:hypothetical protein
LLQWWLACKVQGTPNNNIRTRADNKQQQEQQQQRLKSIPHSTSALIRAQHQAAAEHQPATDRDRLCPQTKVGSSPAARRCRAGTRECLTFILFSWKHKCVAEQTQQHAYDSQGMLSHGSKYSPTAGSKTVSSHAVTSRVACSHVASSHGISEMESSD